MALGDFASILKQLYRNGMDKKACFRDHPAIASIYHDKGFKGDAWKIPVNWANASVNNSSTASLAATNRTQGRYSHFLVPPVSRFGHGRIQGDVVRRAEAGDDKSQFVNAVRMEVDGSIESLGNELSRNLFRNQGGARGVVGSFAGSTITLTDPADAIFWETGHVINASVTDGTTGAIKAGTLTVAAGGVARDTGIITFTTTIAAGIATLANGDSLFINGDFGLGMAGLEAWNPTTPGTLFGVNIAGTDRDRTAGVVYNGLAAGDSLETVFISADARMQVSFGSGFQRGKMYINPYDMAKLKIAKESVRRIDNNNDYKIGITIQDVNGNSFIVDADCPRGIARFVGDGCFTFATCGDQPAVVKDDGSTLRLIPTGGDEYSYDLAVDGNMGSEKPGGLMKIILPVA